MDVVLASANPHKAEEIAQILAPLCARDLVLVARPPEVPEVVEDGETLEDNARLKANALRKATGLPALADDTGLFIVALGGEPGVFSARYAGPHATFADNVALALERLGDAQDRRATFVTVALLDLGDGDELVARGEVDGEIARAPRGEGGFGYDPIFCPVGAAGRSFAEMTLEEKAEYSHRGRAFRDLGAMLVARGLVSPVT